MVQYRQLEFDVEPTSLIVSPNPVFSKGTMDMQIDFETNDYTKLPSGNKNIKIYDLFGRLKFSDDYTGDSYRVQNLELKQGNYIINVTTDQNQVFYKMFIVE